MFVANDAPLLGADVCFAHRSMVAETFDESKVYLLFKRATWRPQGSPLLYTKMGRRRSIVVATLAVAMFYCLLTSTHSTATLIPAKNNGNERDKYPLASKRELRVGATQPPPRREIHPRASATSANGGPR